MKTEELVKVFKNGTVWMLQSEPHISAARLIAVEAMEALKLDPGDFRQRDTVIEAISDSVNGMLNYVSKHERRP